MKGINVITPLPIPASRTKRLLSYVVDLIVAFIVLAFATAIISFGLASTDWMNSTTGKLLINWLAPAFIAYTEYATSGNSFGKKLFGLRLVRNNGQPLTLLLTTIRQPMFWLFISTPFFLTEHKVWNFIGVGVLAMIIVATLTDVFFALGHDKLSLHDRISSAVVVDENQNRMQSPGQMPVIHVSTHLNTAYLINETPERQAEPLLLPTDHGHLGLKTKSAYPKKLNKNSVLTVEDKKELRAIPLTFNASSIGLLSLWMTLMIIGLSTVNFFTIKQQVPPGELMESFFVYFLGVLFVYTHRSLFVNRSVVTFDKKGVNLFIGFRKKCISWESIVKVETNQEKKFNPYQISIEYKDGHKRRIIPIPSYIMKIKSDELSALLNDRI